MSLEAIGWAWNQTTGSPTRKAVLMALANIANHKTGRCDPGIEYICRRTELSQTAVKNALTALVKDGFLNRDRKRRADGSLGTYTYTFPHEARDVQPQTPGDSGLETADDPEPQTPGDSQNQEELPEPGRTEPKTLAAVPAAYDPRKGTKINGRNIPWDALVEVTQADEKVEAGKIAKALKLIRGYVVDTHAEQAFGDERGEHLIAGQIRARARLYRQRWPNMELTPTALASNWARVTTAAPGPDPESLHDAVQRGLDYGRETA